MTSNPQLSVIVLAAGKGTRMKSGKAKVLHEVFFAPMLHHVLQAIAPLSPERTVVIVGHQREAVEKSVAPYSVITVTQEEQLGTGHAVAIAEHAIPGTTDTVMVLCGDTPLIRPETLQEMYATHRNSGADLTVMTTLLDNPTNYGRIITDKNNLVLGIVEEKDASIEQKAIQEINAGIYCVDKQFLFTALAQVDTNNSQGEVYLTDIVAIAVREARKVEKYVCPRPQDVLGVNSRVELAEAHGQLQQRRNVEVMLQGVTIQSPETVSISSAAIVGRDSLIKSGVQIHGTTIVGKKCVIGNGAILTNCKLGDNVEIGPYAVLHDCSMPDKTIVAPHSTTF
ncbi:bifunctional UDP-N-acetylglucosamine diphosphorylase/glucosamine-1-phosphate N-acetyltransferase GlmU [Desulfopila aestuarii]|uniref:UDP-N-acetylglucosamine pyrophosphorylase n=1 Tax=Desulfopila aestuarii DSM 18488 TaxID=1121416 RepID=A0A1M7YIP3_9BACT|nr:NTP transferase domain-containing protein [Desulfopila aestuarii]SHO52507.1 UDP-N-acetylglucosamine pyrophosphorylase [Desulfopila aestuarii DSM 18488]